MQCNAMSEIRHTRLKQLISYRDEVTELLACMSGNHGTTTK